KPSDIGVTHDGKSREARARRGVRRRRVLKDQRGEQQAGGEEHARLSDVARSSAMDRKAPDCRWQRPCGLLRCSDSRSATRLPVYPSAVHLFVVTNAFPPRIGGINYYVD